MKNLSTESGTLHIIERLPNSVNGNPRFLCFINRDIGGTGWTFRTKPDCSYSYDIQNLNGKRVTATIGEYYGKCTLNTIEELYND